MFCTKCGEKLRDDARFCEACGAQAERPQPRPQPEPQPRPQPEPQPRPQPEPQPRPQPEPQPQPYAQPPARAMSVGAYVGSILVMSIPLIGLIFMIIWACGGAANRNRVNLARAYLILLLIAVVLSVCLYLSFHTFAAVLSNGILRGLDLDFDIDLDIWDGEHSIIPTLPTPGPGQFPGILIGP